MVGSQRLEGFDECDRISLTTLAKEHTTPDNNTILLEKPDGEQYTISAALFLWQLI
ncbi:MAG: hypothetical protein LBG19_05415 [Prevotellaceae bacterium]|jgi:hypothetical protein|nr:hypothetical protein [Prevotellaceae bacterium]